MDTQFTALRQSLAPHYGEGEARAIAFMLYEDAFGVSRTDIYADKVRQFSEDERARLNNMCQLLAKGVPVQYVLGKASFCGRTFAVSPAVLIPRPETEELVAWATDVARLMPHPEGRPLRLLDAGTGSGCIAVSLKLALPDADVTAWDISPEALNVARDNARTLGADVHFEQRDILAPPDAAACYDIIVSNPPYICEYEQSSMEAHVTQHEPHTALFVPDADPLRFYRALCHHAKASLSPGGHLLVEINSAYGPGTARLFTAQGLQHVQLRQDAFGLDRMVGGTHCANMLMD